MMGEAVRARNIIFDFCEVFAHGLYGMGEMGSLVQLELGIQKQEYFEKVDMSGLWEVLQELNLGKTSEEQYWKEVIERNQWNARVEDLRRLSRKAARKEIYGTLDVVSRIDRRWHRLFILSDNWREMKADLLNYYPWLETLFEKTYFSCDIGMLKRDSRTFEYVLKDAKLAREQTCFVDDNATNVVSAEAVGIMGIVFRHATQLENALKEYGVHFIK